MVDVPIDAGGAILLGFPFPRGAVDADVEDCTSTEGRERRLFDGGFGDSLRRDLGLGVWILLQDGLEGCSRASADVQHVNGRQRLVGDLVGRRLDISNLVGKLAPYGILVGGGDVGEPEGQSRNPWTFPSSL